MAKLKVFSVRDAKADFFMAPLVMRSRGEAIRMFTASVNTPDHVFSKFPADFSMVEIGEFDELTGQISMNENGPVILGVGVDFKEKPAEQASMPFSGGKVSG